MKTSEYKSDVISTAEAAPLLGVSIRRVQELAATGRIGIERRIGNVILLSRAEVVRLSKKDRPCGWPKGRPRK